MSALVSTRRCLHAVAELLLAGPQYAESGTIKLAPTLHGFGCVAAPGTRVEGGDLLLGTRSVGIDGRSVADLGAELGIQPHSLAEVYRDCTDLPLDQALSLDADATTRIAEAFRLGDRALRSFVPEETPVLWPEHFDLGITVDRVNYGVSPGDDFLEAPYAYVGPWSLEGRTDSFWNAPFGAARPLEATADLPAFFAEGRERATR